MLKLKFAIFLFLTGNAFSMAWAQLNVMDPQTKQECERVKDVPFPEKDRPTAAEAKELANCVSEDLYFGFGQPADPVKARKCAFVEMDQQSSRPFAGKAILMMLYANGRGVDRNFDLAIRLACEVGGAPGDVAGNVHQLMRYKSANWKGTGFNICDHSSGRSLYEQCANLDERFESVKREQHLKEITSKWSERDRQAFQPLQAAAEKYFKAHATQEVDLQSTIEVHEEEFMKNGFVDTLDKFEQGELPQFSAQQVKDADADLDRIYGAIEAKAGMRWGTVTPESISKVEELWKPYRDAWVAFGKEKFPKVDAANWKAWGAQQRAQLLEHFLH
jgi:hypothetical protein